MSELNASNLRKEHGNEGPDLVGTTELTSPYFMVPPSGTTKERPQNPQPGTLRFNTDIGSLEYFRGDTIGWESINRVSPNLGGGTGSNTGTGARGLYGGGQVAPSTGSYTADIDYLTISTLGNAINFGTLSDGNRSGRGVLSSRTRAVFGSGYGPADDMHYVTIASTGNSTAFGLEVANGSSRSGLSNGTRGCFAGRLEGSPSHGNVISYITITSTGNALDFGDLSVDGRGSPGAAASSTRGIWAGGGSSDNEYVTIDYVTISSTGDALDFGDLIGYGGKTNSTAGGSNSTRAIWWGGTDSPGYATTKQITYNTIASAGNSIDFGETSVVTHAGSACPDPTRLVMKLGSESNGTTTTNKIEYVQFASLGDSVDFGDSVNQTYSSSLGSCSSAHGGL